MVIALVGLLGLAGAVITSSAEAFKGEPGVIDALTGDLTGPAKTILTNPTFLPETVEGAGAAVGVGEAGSAAAVFEASGVLPALGAGVLAFGAGVGIGTQICGVLGIEGCWDLTSGSEEPKVEVAHEWLFAGSADQFFPGSLPFTWYYKSTGGCGYTCSYIPPQTCGAKAPTAVSSFVRVGPLEEACGGFGKGTYERSGMQNRTLTYNATDDPGIPNYEPGGKPYAASGDWSEKLADQIQGHEGDPAARLGENIASRIPGSGVANPYALTVEIPNCDGLVYAACEELLEERGLTPSRETRTWEDADPDGDPDEVLELDPARATEVEKGTTVVVTTNPDEAGMPVIVPSPEPGETYDEYAARLNPLLSPSKTLLTDATLDPSAGPDAVVGVNPVAGTRFDPAGPPVDVNVRVNPPDAPPVGGGGGGGDCDASVGAIDFTPLLNQEYGDRFPFGVFVFLGDLFSEWSGVGEVPQFDLPIVPEGILGSDGVTLHVDFHFLQPYAEPFRIAILLMTFMGMLWFLATAAMRIQGDDS